MTDRAKRCECDHMRGSHYARPDYYGGPVTKGDAQCGLCRCEVFTEGKEQFVVRFMQSEHGKD